MLSEHPKLIAKGQCSTTRQQNILPASGMDKEVFAEQAS
jgi:hypothetical protein